MQRIAILGSTGSIGENTLKVVSQYPSRFKVVALTAYSDFKRLAEQVKQYKPTYVADSKEYLEDFKKLGIKGIKLFPAEACSDIAADPIVDTVVLAMRGAGALMPFLAAVRAGKRVAAAGQDAADHDGPGADVDPGSGAVRAARRGACAWDGDVTNAD